jgi:hypothetical protein
MKKFSVSSLLALIALIALTQCETVKPYQRVYLNDTEMRMGQAGARAFEENVHANREGAVGGDSRKVSGGCGCN